MPLPLPKRARLLPLLLSALAASPLSGQTVQAAPVASAWHTLLTGEDGTVVSIDTATVARTSRTNYSVRTAIRFPRRVTLASGETVDREVDHEEIDCAGLRSRGIDSEIYDGDTRLRVTTLSHEWAAVAPGRQAVFDASCEFLLGPLAPAAAKGYSLDAVERQPELTNRTTVAQLIGREYPPILRRMGQTGTVTLRFNVRTDGTVDRNTVSVVAATDPAFGDAARRVVYAMHFRPAQLNGAPVAVWVVLPIVFRLAYGPGAIDPSPGAPPPIPPLPRTP